MSNTIELLETIGKSASLRHAQAEHLAQTLTDLDASKGLKQAAASGDSSYLNQELGYRALETPHNVSQTVPEEEEYEPGQHDSENDDTNPSQDGEERDA